MIILDCAHITRSIPEVGGADRSERSFCIEVHHLGPEIWLHVRGFVSTVSYGDAFRTKVSGRYREGGRLSGVTVKRVYFREY